jgi:hypothetical protein
MGEPILPTLAPQWIYPQIPQISSFFCMSSGSFASLRETSNETCCAHAGPSGLRRRAERAGRCNQCLWFIILRSSRATSGDSPWNDPDRIW